jgi:flagellar biosynthesis protein
MSAESIPPRAMGWGRSRAADSIVRAAEAAGVPVRHIEGLMPLLMRVDLDDTIPPSLYVAVAEVLAYVNRLEGGEPGAP